MKKNILFFLLTLSIFSVFGNTFIKTIGGAKYDIAYSGRQTTDGGYIMAGKSNSFGDLINDFYLVKADSNGNEQWHNTFGGVGAYVAYSVKQTVDGGYILAGYNEDNPNFQLVKTDENGNKEWKHSYGNDEDEYAFSVFQTTDGGYIVAGQKASGSNGRYNFWLLKVDNNGIEEWNKTFIFGDYNSACAYSVIQTADGGYMIAGEIIIWNSGRDFWLVKTDANGNEEWNETYSAVNKYDDIARSVKQTNDGGYIVAGYSSAYNSDSDFCLIKVTSSGNEEWCKIFGGSGSDEAYSVDTTSDGGYIIAGGTSSSSSSEDVWLVKTNSNGDSIWNQTFGNDYNDVGREVMQTTDGGYIIAGYSVEDNGNYIDAYLIKTDENGSSSINDKDKLQITNYDLSQNYPNPFNPTTKITYKLATTDYKSAKVVVYNTMGEIVWSSPIHASQTTGFILFDGSDFNSGIYYYSLVVDGKRLSTKSMALIK